MGVKMRGPAAPVSPPAPAGRFLMPVVPVGPRSWHGMSPGMGRDVPSTGRDVPRHGTGCPQHRTGCPPTRDGTSSAQDGMSLAQHRRVPADAPEVIHLPEKRSANSCSRPFP